MDLGLLSMMKQREGLRQKLELLENGIGPTDLEFQTAAVAIGQPNIKGYGTGMCVDCGKTISRNKARCAACFGKTGRDEQ